ncbi:MAG: hypothetical protein EOO79_07470 [Oxalobacteraceae bacterium]|nr:MAG: hypothetical protein EOO79_07470 [Oxalobacteraceae bacterium]
MIYLTMTTEASSIRAYHQPNGYEKRLPYLAIVQVKHLTDKVVYLCGAVGVVDRETWMKLLDLLRTGGITTVMLERHGRMKTIELSAPAASQPTEQ